MKVFFYYVEYYDQNCPELLYGQLFMIRPDLGIETFEQAKDHALCKHPEAAHLQVLEVTQSEVLAGHRTKGG